VIVKTTLHGGDRLLGRHLARADHNESVEVIARPAFTDALSIPEMVTGIKAGVMARRKGKAIKRPLIHAALSPAVDQNDDQAVQMARDYLALQGLPSDDILIVAHVKKRADGSAIRHYHVVAPAITADGKVFNDHWLYRRNETFARMFEFDHEQGALTRGRHNVSAVRALQDLGRPDAAAAVAAACAGPRRRAATSTGEGASNARLGVGRDLLAALAGAWTETVPFALVLAPHGCAVAKRDGDTTVGVYRGAQRLGDLSRLLRNAGVAGVRRRDVEARVRAEAAAVALVKVAKSPERLELERPRVEQAADPDYFSARVHQVTTRTKERIRAAQLEAVRQPQRAAEAVHEVEVLRAQHGETVASMLKRHRFAAAIVAMGEIVWILARKLAEHLVGARPDTHSSDGGQNLQDDASDLAPLTELTQESTEPAQLTLRR
jgi:hypothetical protein